MAYSGTKLSIAICCFLLGGAAVHCAYQWRTVGSHRDADNLVSDSANGTADEPRLLSFEQMVGQYGLQELPAGAVVTDKGRALHAFVASRPYSLSPAARNLPVVRHHLRMADLVCLDAPNGQCDCFGWVFLGGRGWLLGQQVPSILEDNGYSPVDAPQAGDVVIYRDASGHIRHSGLVFRVDHGEPIVESKWGDQGRYLHHAQLTGYGQQYYFRSNRGDHKLRGWEDISPSAANLRVPAED